MEEKFDNIVANLIEMFESGDSSKIGSVIEGMRAPDLADVLSALPEEVWIFVFRELDTETASGVLSIVDEGVARDILEDLHADEIVHDALNALAGLAETIGDLRDSSSVALDDAENVPASRCLAPRSFSC